MFHPRACLAASLAMACAGVWARPAAALDMETALHQVAASNPTIAARGAMVDAARRRVGPAGAWSSPMLELGVVNVPTSGRLDMDPMTMKMVGLSQRVPLFGGNGLARQAAREAVAGESAAAEMTAFEVYGMTWEAFTSAYYAGELARLAEAHQDLMEHMVHAARARYESGNGRLEDVLRAQAEQARSLADVATYRAEQLGARARLDALRGVASGEPGDTLVPPPVATVPPAPDAWLAAVSATHPRLREKQAQVDRYRFSARAARRMVWPDLELRGSYGRREPLDGVVPQDDMFSATVGFIVPIFAASREGSEGREMDAMARASESERQAAELDLRAQVIATHAAAAAAQRIVGLLADTVVTTQRQATEASWVSYRAGSTDLWRTFESTHALYAEEVALLRARQELARTLAQMVSLTGRGDLFGVALPEPRSQR
jgi:outer membrane protein TolC